MKTRSIKWIAAASITVAGVYWLFAAQVAGIKNGMLQSDLDAGGYKIINSATPTTSSALATKGYVDTNAISTNQLPAMVKDLGALNGISGDLLVFDGTHLIRLSVGSEGFVVAISNGLPTYTTNLPTLFITNLYSTIINSTTINVITQNVDTINATNSIRVNGKQASALSVNGTAAPIVDFTDSATSKFALSSTNLTANPTNLTDAQISASAAIAKSKISTSGTWAVADIPSLPASQITSGTFNTNQLPALAADLGNLVATITTGDLIQYNGTHLSRLPASTSGYVLTANGAGTASNYQAPAAGGTTISVNGTNVTTPNFQDSATVALGLSGSNITATASPTTNYNGINVTTLNVGTLNLTNAIPPSAVSINNYSAYAVGTAYTLSATYTNLAFGTTTTAMTIAVAGAYVIHSHVGVKYTGATYVGAQTITLKIRRTNGTPADLSNAVRIMELPVLTTFTGGDVVALPPVFYAASAGDVIEIYGSVSATPSAGTVTADSAEIIAFRIQ